jgi:octaprenyl-diphosphate synthase
LTTSSVISTSRPRLADIQSLVEGRLDEVMDELQRIIVAEFDMIEEVNEYLLLLRGKLFRPTLVLLSNQVGGASSDHGVTLASVVELVHLATLVHDDAVDHSVLRRGLPTINALWTHQIAIIMGDYLYSRAVTELADLGDITAVGVLARAANEMSVGEMRQLTSYDALDFTEDDYYRLIAAKTASLMAAACEMGSLSGPPENREALRSYGHNLGMAFQIADDLLDYTGSADVTGKPTGHDLRERKVTLPLIGALKSVTPKQREEIRSFFTLVEPTDADIAAIVQIVEDCGGLDYARGRATEYSAAAEAALDDLPEGSAVEALKMAVAYATGRSH